jgi:hypothetical protein
MVLFPLCFGTAGTILRVQTDSVVKYGFPVFALPQFSIGRHFRL